MIDENHDPLAMEAIKPKKNVIAKRNISAHLGPTATRRSSLVGNLYPPEWSFLHSVPLMGACGNLCSDRKKETDEVPHNIPAQVTGDLKLFKDAYTSKPPDVVKLVDLVDSAEQLSYADGEGWGKIGGG